MFGLVFSFRLGLHAEICFYSLYLRSNQDWILNRLRLLSRDSRRTLEVVLKWGRG